MNKEIKKEIIKYFNKNWPAQKAMKNEKIQQLLYLILGKKKTKEMN